MRELKKNKRNCKKPDFGVNYWILSVSETTVETAKKPIAPALRFVGALSRCTSKTLPLHCVSESMDRRYDRNGSLTENFLLIIVDCDGTMKSVLSGLKISLASTVFRS